MKRFFFLILIFGLLSISCNSQNYQSKIALAYQEKMKIEKNPHILDVRSPEEFAAGQIENALNINWNSENFNDKNKTV